MTSSSAYDFVWYSTSARTTYINWVIEFYDGTAGVIKGFVEVTASDTSDTTYYPSWGNAAITTPQSPGNPFDTYFQCVLPLPDGTTLNIADYSQQNLPLRMSNPFGNPVLAGAGKLDGGASYNGSGQFFGTFSTNLSLAGTAASVFAWVNFNSVASQQYIAAQWEDGFSPHFDWRLGINSSGNIIASVGDHTSTADTVTGATTISTGSFVQIGFVKNGTGAGALKCYLNGVADGSVTSNVTLQAPATGLEFGVDNNGNDSLNAISDQIEIANSSFSQTFITTSYNSQNSTSTFGTLSSTAPSTGGILTPSNLQGNLSRNLRGNL